MHTRDGFFIVSCLQTINKKATELLQWPRLTYKPADYLYEYSPVTRE